ncbi:MAG: hypothetical protein AB7C97_13155 [Oscillospiraceae bacterium]
MTFEKLYNELFALVSLKYFWKEYKDGFEKSESPDWVNKEMGFGMEVSQALLQNDGESQNFIELYLGKKREEIPDTAFEKFGAGMYFYNGRLWALSAQEDTGGVDYVRKAMYRFDKKLEKLCSNYKRFPSNGLYLFLHTGRETEEGIRDVFFYIKNVQEKSLYSFQLVFLCCDAALYILDFVNEEIEIVPIPSAAEDFLKAETEKLRNSRQWKQGTRIFDTTI